MRSTIPEFDELIEQSEDVQSDAMRATRAGLADLVEEAHDRGGAARARARAGSGPDPEEEWSYQDERRRLLGAGLIGSAVLLGSGFAAGLFEWLASPAAAAGMDVQAAQTAAALENLAVAVYQKASALPFMKTIPDPAGATIDNFVTTTVKQHQDHADAFNGAAVSLGGKKQTGVDQVVMTQVVNPTLPTLTDPLKVVNFAADLEYVAAQTFAAETAAVSDKSLRGAFSSITGVENQHRTVLLAVAALLQNNLAGQIKIPPDAAQLPAAAGSVGFPESFLSLNQARPAGEAAVS